MPGGKQQRTPDQERILERQREAEKTHIERRGAQPESGGNRGSVAHRQAAMASHGSQAGMRAAQSAQAQMKKMGESDPKVPASSKEVKELDHLAEVDKALQAEASEASEASEAGVSSKPASAKLNQPDQIDAGGEKIDKTSDEYLVNLHGIAMEVQADLQYQTFALAEKLSGGCMASFAIDKAADETEEATRVGEAEIKHVNRIAQARDQSADPHTLGKMKLNIVDFDKKRSALKQAYIEDKNKEKYIAKMTALYKGFKRPVTQKALENEVKGLARIAEKKQKYKDDYSAFTDIARSSLIFESPRALLNAKGGILQSLWGADQEVVREKNRFKEPTDDGYSDILLNVKDGKHDGHIFELQLHVKGLYDAKTAKLAGTAKQNMFASDSYKAVAVSARTLLAAHANRDDFELPTKAVGSAEKIRDKGEFSGHDVYNVKRFIFEQDQGKGPFCQEVASWAEFAKEHFYQPASEKIGGEGSVEPEKKEVFEELTLLTFLDPKRPGQSA
jgi:hypothetical protein